MGWNRLEASLRALFADAWSQGLTDTAIDLAWIIMTLRQHNIRVTPGLRALLDFADAGSDRTFDPTKVSAARIQALAKEMRAVITKHAQLGEHAASYTLPGISRV